MGPTRPARARRAGPTPPRSPRSRRLPPPTERPCQCRATSPPASGGVTEGVAPGSGRRPVAGDEGLSEAPGELGTPEASGRGRGGRRAGARRAQRPGRGPTPSPSRWLSPLPGGRPVARRGAPDWLALLAASTHTRPAWRETPAGPLRPRPPASLLSRQHSTPLGSSRRRGAGGTQDPSGTGGC